MRPMIPPEAFVDLRHKVSRPSKSPLRIVYSGKLAAAWKTPEMLELPRALRDHGISAEFRVVGDKFNRNSQDPHWAGRMKESLLRAHEDPDSGITWVGGLSRVESLKEIAKADLGIGWRSAELDSSLEISTKALEYSAAGTIPLVNRTNDNIEFFGPDYPLFVTSGDDVGDVATVIRDGLSALNDYVAPIQKAAREYSIESARARLRKYFTRAGPSMTQSRNLMPITGRLNW